MKAPDGPLLVGITGGIGAGKSTIAKIFEVLGIPVYYADQRAAWIMDNNPEIQKELKVEFGPETVESGKINKAFLRKKIFSDPQAREKINAIVHPAVGRDFAQWKAENSEHAYLLKEAALLIESGSYKNLDILIGVFSNKATRIERILIRDTFREKKEVEDIIGSQMKDEDMKKYCHLVIENNGTEPILDDILRFDKSLRAFSKDKKWVA